MDANGIQMILESLGCDRINVRTDKVVSSCPFAPWEHNEGIDRHPSFNVEINGSGTSKWNCYACGNGANQTYSLIMRYQDKSGHLREDLLEMIRAVEGQSLSYRLSHVEWKPTKPIQNPTYVQTRIPDYEPTYDVNQYAHVLAYFPNYAVERNLTIDQARRFGLGLLSRGMRLADGYKSSTDRLFFVIKDHTGKMVGWSGRRISDEPWSNGEVPPKYHHAPGMKKEKYLYGENLIDHSQDYCFITESFMDVLNLDLFGVKNVLAIFGANASIDQIKKITKWFKKVFILRHDDPAGQRMASEMKSTIETMTPDVEVIIVEPIEGRKDSGEWQRDETRDLFRSLGVWNESEST